MTTEKRSWFQRLMDWMTTDVSTSAETVPTQMDVRTIIKGSDDEASALATERTFMTGRPHIANELHPGVWEVRMLR